MVNLCSLCISKFWLFEVNNLELGSFTGFIVKVWTQLEFNYLLFLSNNIINTGNHLKTFVNNTYYLLAFLDLDLEKKIYSPIIKYTLDEFKKLYQDLKYSNKPTLVSSLVSSLVSAYSFGDHSLRPTRERIENRLLGICPIDLGLLYLETFRGSQQEWS